MDTTPPPHLRGTRLDGELYVSVEDLVAYFRWMQETVDQSQVLHVEYVAGHIADQLRDRWIDASAKELG